MTEKTNEAAQVIGARVKECRHAKQWTINELAKELERVSGRSVSAASVGNWECGLRVPIEDMPPALAKVFDMPADYFERPPLMVDANPPEAIPSPGRGCARRSKSCFRRVAQAERGRTARAMGAIFGAHGCGRARLLPSLRAGG